MHAAALRPMPVALSNGEVLLVIVFAAIPVAAAAFVGVGTLYRQIGRGLFLDEDELPEETTQSTGLRDSMAEASPRVREDEIRQMLKGKAYRQRRRGEEPIEVEDALRRLTRADEEPRVDAELVTEVRQLVIARNERRLQRGEEPLAIDSEVERQLRELG